MNELTPIQKYWLVEVIQDAQNAIKNKAADIQLYTSLTFAFNELNAAERREMIMREDSYVNKLLTNEKSL